jgi:hypothetical protein
MLTSLADAARLITTAPDNNDAALFEPAAERLSSGDNHLRELSESAR